MNVHSLPIHISRWYMGLEIDIHEHSFHLIYAHTYFSIRLKFSAHIGKLKKDRSKDTEAAVSNSVMFFPELLHITTAEAVCLQFCASLIAI